jgi:hypothetical protein
MDALGLSLPRSSTHVQGLIRENSKLPPNVSTLNSIANELEEIRKEQTSSGDSDNLPSDEEGHHN